MYALLRRKILEHEIPPATRINIHHISEELGVSPTPVREALRLLQGDNLLVATSNKGYATTALLNLDQVRNLFELRLLLEPWAARMAAVNSLRNPARLLKQEIDDFHAIERPTRHSVVAHDNRLHHTIMRATGNENVVVAEHEQIHDAIAAHDPDAAEDAMRRHLHSAYIRFVPNLTNGEPGAVPLDPIELKKITPTS